MIVGAGIIWNGGKTIISALNGVILPRPASITLWVALISIIAKEWLFRYTVAVGRRIDSPVVIANGWHHRSDAFSSIGVLIGIAGAMFLGEHWRILDPIASLIVGVFILMVAFKLAKPSIDELLDTALPADIEQEIIEIILATPDVCSFHHLRTRRNGRAYILDMHIQVNPDMTLIKAHDIASDVEDALKQKFGEQTQINIHVEPAKDLK